MVPKWRANSQKVLEALIDLTWVSDLQGPLNVGILAECLDLWDLVVQMNLQPEVDDTNIWSLAPSREYSARSAYDGFFQG
jgi:hypothetical protein